MNYWIFTAAPYENDSESYTARQIYEQRMKDRFWGLGVRTPNRKNVRKGDQIIYYIARPESSFAGTSRLSSDCFKLDADQQSKFAHSSTFFTAEYGVHLDAIQVWENSHSVAALAGNLKFIKNPTQWWTYLQGGIRQIEESDYSTIVAGLRTVAPVFTAEELGGQSLFALEAHLEEFIEHNWSKINWGAELELFQQSEQKGRQFPAGTWSIDFLAIDRKENELVVIELKRGQSSDAAVGQVLRYVNWVRKNVAAPNQKVRGIVVAHEVDDSLRFAAREMPNVTVKTYAVTFSLQATDLG